VPLERGKGDPRRGHDGRRDGRKNTKPQKGIVKGGGKRAEISYLGKKQRRTYLRRSKRRVAGRAANKEDHGAKDIGMRSDAG